MSEDDIFIGRENIGQIQYSGIDIKGKCVKNMQSIIVQKLG